MASLVEVRLHDCAALPKGWKRQEVLRRNGLTSGKSDIYYYSPSGKKFRSKPQLARHLGDSVDLSTFDYRTGKINPMMARKNCKKSKGTLFDYRENNNNKKDYSEKKKEHQRLKEKKRADEERDRFSRGIRNDASLVPPIRQTASIFKQPVTAVKTQPASRTKEDLKQNCGDKPKQVFWEKRLQGLQAFDVQTEVLRTVELPSILKGIGPNIADQTVLQSLATALHVLPGPITGQTESRQFLEKNPGVFVNPNQPLIAAVTIGEEDILLQEDRVGDARQKLQEALAKL